MSFSVFLVKTLIPAVFVCFGQGRICPAVFVRVICCPDLHIVPTLLFHWEHIESNIYAFILKDTNKTLCYNEIYPDLHEPTNLQEEGGWGQDGSMRERSWAAWSSNSHGNACERRRKNCNLNWKASSWLYLDDKMQGPITNYTASLMSMVYAERLCTSYTAVRIWSFVSGIHSNKNATMWGHCTDFPEPHLLK